MLADAHDPLIGAILAGRYKILARLARGGMSSVYLARHVLIERLSAIKILRRDLCDDPVQRDRFLREARAVNRINHENIIEIVDYGESEDGRVYLVMEYLPGESLLQRVSRGPIAPVRALDIAKQITSGLARAHQMGVIHRDLKPDNILLLPSNNGGDIVKVLDFGIAKLTDQPALTATDKIFGTPGYIAPEYAAGNPIDGRADLYSLGVVLYEMVTAQLPFDVEFPADLLLKHMLEPPIPPRERNPAVPEPVERLILQLLAKDPAQRYRDAYHLLEDLEAVSQLLSGRIPARKLPVAHDVPAFDDDTMPVDLDSAVIPPPLEIGAGVMGARAWERYISAYRRERTTRRSTSPSPAVTAQLRRMESVLEPMRERTDRIEQLRTRMLALEAKGRDFRTTIGRAIDTLAGDLSVKARERDSIASEHAELERRRDASLAKGDAGQADALLWEIAAAGEVLREAVSATEDLEFQLNELNAQLERLSEALEVDQNGLLTDLDDALRQIAAHDETLRSLLRSMPE
jgi:serine/threonine-protein kinase